VRAPSSFDYAIVRVIPRVEREEFVNAGVIVYCFAHDFLGARIELDEARLLALAPDADLPLIRRHLAAIPRVCAGGASAGPIGLLPQRERFNWLVAPRSTILQTSPAHSGMCAEPEAALEKLIERAVRVTRAT
jgi:hypothetical protein